MSKETASIQMFKTAEQTALALMSDEELSEERLMELFGDLTINGELACDVLADVAGRMAMVKTRMEQLNEYSSMLKNLDMRIKSSIKRSMELIGETNLDCGVYRLTIAKNPGSLDDSQATEIPTEFAICVPAQIVLDKKAVLAALRSGEKVEGYSIKTGTNLRIK